MVELIRQQSQIWMRVIWTLNVQIDKQNRSRKMNVTAIK